MIDLEILKKFVWSEPKKIDKPGNEYDKYISLFGAAKALWSDGTENPLGISILLAPGEELDMSKIISKLHIAILSVEEVLIDKEAKLL